MSTPLPFLPDMLDDIEDLKQRVEELEKKVDMRGSRHYNKVRMQDNQWRAKGGRTRAQRMTPKERSASASKAAQARWGNREKQAGEAAK